MTKTTLQAKLLVTNSPTSSCDLLVDVEVNKIGSMKVKTGKGIFHEFEDFIIDAILRVIDIKVPKLMNKIISKTFVKQMSSFPFCH